MNNGFFIYYLTNNSLPSDNDDDDDEDIDLDLYYDDEPNKFLDLCDKYIIIPILIGLFLGGGLPVILSLIVSKM